MKKLTNWEKGLQEFWYYGGSYHNAECAFIVNDEGVCNCKTGKNREINKSYIHNLLSQQRAEIVKELNNFVADERDKTAKDTNAFNELNDEYKEGYWIAMNTVMKFLDRIKAIE